MGQGCPCGLWVPFIPSYAELKDVSMDLHSSKTLEPDGFHGSFINVDVIYLYR